MQLIGNRTLIRDFDGLRNGLEVLSRDVGALSLNGNSLTRDVGALFGDANDLSFDTGALTFDAGTLNVNADALSFDTDALSFDPEALSFDPETLSFDVFAVKSCSNTLIMSRLYENPENWSKTPVRDGFMPGVPPDRHAAKLFRRWCRPLSRPARMGKNRRAIPVENKFCGQ